MASKLSRKGKRTSVHLRSVVPGEGRPLLRLGDIEIEASEVLIHSLAEMVAEEMKARGLLGGKSKEATRDVGDSEGAA